MSDDLLDIVNGAGRDERTPLAWHGTPYRKRYYDWLRHCWRTDVLILIGTRQEAPGVPWAERHGNQDKGAPPTIPRRDLSPQGQRTEAHKETGVGKGSKAGTTTLKLRAYLKRNPGASLTEIYAAHPDVAPATIRDTLCRDSQIERVGDSFGKGRRSPSESRWRLKGGGG